MALKDHQMSFALKATRNEIKQSFKCLIIQWNQWTPLLEVLVSTASIWITVSKFKTDGYA
jgi:hypothetical protein